MKEAKEEWIDVQFINTGKEMTTGNSKKAYSAPNMPNDLGGEDVVKGVDTVSSHLCTRKGNLKFCDNYFAINLISHPPSDREFDPHRRSVL
ncbi:hypothetical protein DPMN_054346 [Dreissena polymorpha]|uniref:Uncharacterized protein n=1 Tax=Dreissena polymorpha TaxID=45954 RepID=A0A9D4CQD8_DREPO|nr:hypothetical protein DPMN_054346 [Dreissena polymorpha]